MKKVIEKMGEKAAEEQRRALSQDGGPAPVGGPSPVTGAAGGKEPVKGGRKWLGGAIRRVTGGGDKEKKGDDSLPETSGETIDEGGLQVDFYLVIVRHFSSLIALTDGTGWVFFSDELRINLLHSS